MNRLNFIKENISAILIYGTLFTFFSYVIISCPAEARYHDPYNRYIKRHGQNTVGEIISIEREKAGLAVWVSYAINGVNYQIYDKYYPENYHSTFLQCSYDSSCYGNKYLVKYLPERPEKGAACFDRPVADSSSVKR